MKESELLRLACLYAEQDRNAYLDAISDTDQVEERKTTRAFLAALKKYRLRRWGKSRMEREIEGMQSIDVFEVSKRHRDGTLPFDPINSKTKD